MGFNSLISLFLAKILKVEDFKEPKLLKRGRYSMSQLEYLSHRTVIAMNLEEGKYQLVIVEPGFVSWNEVDDESLCIPYS